MLPCKKIRMHKKGSRCWWGALTGGTTVSDFTAAKKVMREGFFIACESHFSKFNLDLLGIRDKTILSILA